MKKKKIVKILIKVCEIYIILGDCVGSDWNNSIMGLDHMPYEI